MLIIALQDVRSMRIRSERFLDKIEQDLIPITSGFSQITEDIRQITYAARCQIEKVDSAVDLVNKNVNSIIEKWVATINVLNDAVVEPIEEIAVFLKGFSKGLKYFFGNGKDNKDSG